MFFLFYHQYNHNYFLNLFYLILNIQFLYYNLNRLQIQANISNKNFKSDNMNLYKINKLINQNMICININILNNLMYLNFIYLHNNLKYIHKKVLLNFYHLQFNILLHHSLRNKIYISLNIYSTYNLQNNILNYILNKNLSSHICYILICIFNNL